MELCHVITVDRNLGLTHDLRPADFHLAMPSKLLLMTPKSFANRLYPLAALQKPEALVLGSYPWASTSSVGFIFYMVIVDDLEKKPLFFHQPQNRALLMLGEMAHHIASGLMAFGFSLQKLLPKPTENSLEIHVTLSPGNSFLSTVGGVMCFGAFLDGLLFERGLKLAEKNILASTDIKAEHFFVIEKIWAKSHHD